WVTAKGGTVLACTKQLRDFRTKGHQCANWHTAAKSLRQGHGIWHNRAFSTGQIRVLEAKPCAGTSNSGLDFIKYQQCAVGSTAGSYLCEIAGRKITDTGFALYRLQNNGGHCVIHFGF